MATDDASLHVIGVIRDRGIGDTALTVWLSESISDADLRDFHEYVNKWRVERQEPRGMPGSIDDTDENLRQCR